MSENRFLWVCKPFHELSVLELYAILRLRSEVFVLEQNCIFLDPDNKDQYCHHIMGWDGDRLVACSRLVPKGISYPEFPSIGRVVCHADYRRIGAGKALMNCSMQQLWTLFPEKDIKIGAQLYLKSFYEGFGFEQSSEIYHEDGIDHIEMHYTAG